MYVCVCVCQVHMYIYCTVILRDVGKVGGTHYRGSTHSMLIVLTNECRENSRTVKGDIAIKSIRSWEYICMNW